MTVKSRDRNSERSHQDPVSKIRGEKISSLPGMYSLCQSRRSSGFPSHGILFPDHERWEDQNSTACCASLPNFIECFPPFLQSIWIRTKTMRETNVQRQSFKLRIRFALHTTLLFLFQLWIVSMKTKKWNKMY